MLILFLSDIQPRNTSDKLISRNGDDVLILCTRFRALHAAGGCGAFLMLPSRGTAT